MITHLKKWGHSLALRIPKTLAADLNLEANSTVEIKEEQGRLILVSVRKSGFTLEK
jgi:antitoxin MazE